MRFAVRVTTVVGIVTGLGVMGAGPALAGSIFLNGFFTHRLDSREYNADDEGYHVFAKTDADCPGSGSIMVVRLVEERFLLGDKEYPWRTLSCNGTNQNRSWLATSDGDHHLTFEKDHTDETRHNWYVAGTVHFP